MSMDSAFVYWLYVHTHIYINVHVFQGGSFFLYDNVAEKYAGIFLNNQRDVG